MACRWRVGLRRAWPPNGLALPSICFAHDRPVASRQAMRPAMPTSSLTWSSDRVEQLKRCFDAGLTCSQIAREIGVTRNAVIGKMNRMGLSRPRDLLAAQMRRAAKLARPKRETWRRLTVIAQRRMLREAFPQVQP